MNSDAGEHVLATAATVKTTRRLRLPRPPSLALAASYGRVYL